MATPHTQPGWSCQRPLPWRPSCLRCHPADALLWSAHALPQALQARLQARQQGVCWHELAWHHDLRKVDDQARASWQALPVRTAQPTQALAHPPPAGRAPGPPPLAAPVNQIAPACACKPCPCPRLCQPAAPAGVGRSAEDHACSESWQLARGVPAIRLGPEQVQGGSGGRPPVERSQKALTARQPLAAGRWNRPWQPRSPTRCPDASLWPTWLAAARRNPWRCRAAALATGATLRLLAAPPAGSRVGSRRRPESPPESPPSPGTPCPRPAARLLVAHNEGAGMWVFASGHHRPRPAPKAAHPPGSTAGFARHLWLTAPPPPAKPRWRCPTMPSCTLRLQLPSFQRGASHPHELVERAAALGYRALALTDECSVARVVRPCAGQGAGAAPHRGQRVAYPGFRLVALAQCAGLGSNLCQFITAARRRVRPGGSHQMGPDVQQPQGCELLLVPERTVQTPLILLVAGALLESARAHLV